jgi:hypothetical protein
MTPQETTCLSLPRTCGRKVKNNLRLDLDINYSHYHLTKGKRMLRESFAVVAMNISQSRSPTHGWTKTRDATGLTLPFSRNALSFAKSVIKLHILDIFLVRVAGFLLPLTLPLQKTNW